jgi:hypothetical protein
MKIKLDRAKELYFNYLGNKFQMMRDGVSEEYYKYDITEIQEKEWMDEIFDNELKKMNINDVNSFSSIYLILRFSSQIINQNLQKVTGFVMKNECNVTDTIKFLIFSQKIIEIIDFYLENNNELIDRMFLINEKQKILKIREKYL